jgi:hypothetical protein
MAGEIINHLQNESADQLQKYAENGRRNRQKDRYRKTSTERKGR